MLHKVLQNLPFLFIAITLSASLCGVFFWRNLFKKVLCLGLFSSSIVLLYIALGFLVGGSAPIEHNVITNTLLYANPLPSVLMLTAIVVGISVQAIAFSLLVRVKKDYGTLDEKEIVEILKNN